MLLSACTGSRKPYRRQAEGHQMFYNGIIFTWNEHTYFSSTSVFFSSLGDVSMDVCVFAYKVTVATFVSYRQNFHISHNVLKEYPGTQTVNTRDLYTPTRSKPVKINMPTYTYWWFP